MGVIDRNMGFSIGGIFAQEIKAALWNTQKHVPIFGFIAGIGGRDVTPEVIESLPVIAALTKVALRKGPEVAREIMEKLNERNDAG